MSRFVRVCLALALLLVLRAAEARQVTGRRVKVSRERVFC
jgi:hypothetical protein